MTTLDRLLEVHADEMLKEVRPEQIERLLAGIGVTDRELIPTNTSTERLQ